jgi:hypothetical protein
MTPPSGQVGPEAAAAALAAPPRGDVTPALHVAAVMMRPAATSLACGRLGLGPSSSQTSRIGADIGH